MIGKIMKKDLMVPKVKGEIAFPFKSEEKKDPKTESVKTQFPATDSKREVLGNKLDYFA